MTAIPPRPRGGTRPSAGRKPGSGHYGEPTQPLRVTGQPAAFGAGLAHTLGCGVRRRHRPGVYPPSHGAVPAAYGFRIGEDMELVIWGVVTHAIRLFG